MLENISPIDGRYAQKTKSLSQYFSEYALIKYRVKVELKYLEALCQFDNIIPTKLHEKVKLLSKNVLSKFTVEDAGKIKDIEKTTNHDVKAVEYFLKEKIESYNLNEIIEFVHFGLTSQDINNTAFPLMIKDGLTDIMLPALDSAIIELKKIASEYHGIPMLARTHGQPASPTTLGKEIEVFIERLENEIALQNSIQLRAKFGGATGNFNAHLVSYPTIDWISFGDNFIAQLGLERHLKSTQIAHYDDLAAIFHSWMRLSVILIDFCRDIWTYISMDYFKQKVVKGEIGSSAMPHKVNPIDFENAEGNLGVAIALFDHLALKLPISRLQRDLTDSTVMRNIGVPFGHVLIAFQSINKGISKLELNSKKLEDDLNQNWAVTAEAIQNILRREGYPKPYEALKELTRGNHQITEESIQTFITSLNVSNAVKMELRNISPHNYVGYF
jgi:adenylosuccinate lyase